MAGTGCGVHRHCVAGCPACQRIASHYDRRRRAAIAAGTWQPAVSADAVNAHVGELRRAGMSLRAIADAGQVAYKTLTELPNRQYIHGPTAAAILAVQPAAPSAPAGFVPAVGAARRVRALAAIGWSLTGQARRLGWCTQQVWELAWDRSAFVAVRTDAAVRGLFEAVCLTSGSSARARNAAAKHGWPPPLAWLDIDDPDEIPDLGGVGRRVVDVVAIERALDGERVRLNRAERHHAIHVALGRGMARQVVSDRLRISWSEITRLEAVAPPAEEFAA